MGVEEVVQITQAKSDEGGMGKTEFCRGIDSRTSDWNASVIPRQNSFLSVPSLLSACVS